MYMSCSDRQTVKRRQISEVGRKHYAFNKSQNHDAVGTDPLIRAIITYTSSTVPISCYKLGSGLVLPIAADQGKRKGGWDPD